MSDTPIQDIDSQKPKAKGFNLKVERELNARASMLDQDWDLGIKDTLKVIARGWVIIN